MSGLYDKGREDFLESQTRWTTAVLKAVLFDSGYVPAASHLSLADIPAPSRLSTVTLSGRSATSGVADAADLLFVAPPAGRTAKGYAIYKDTGTESTSRLICWVDTYLSGAAISFLTNGGDVTVEHDLAGVFIL